MTVLSRPIVWLLFLVSATAVFAQETGDPSRADTEIDPEALEVLRDLADHLGAAQQFAFEAETSYDSVQESGAKVEFGASRRILVSRPNRLRLEGQRRDGTEAVSVFDGMAIWVHSAAAQAYATIEQPGDLDEAVDFANGTLRMKAPLADLISPEFYDQVSICCSATTMRTSSSGSRRERSHCPGASSSPIARSRANRSSGHSS
jgi:hypothetical protein